MSYRLWIQLIDSLFSIKEPKLAKVEYDFEARNSDELSLDKGDIVTILDQGDGGWWKGDLNGKIGTFPSNVSLFMIDIGIRLDFFVVDFFNRSKFS